MGNAAIGECLLEVGDLSVDTKSIIAHDALPAIWRRGVATPHPLRDITAQLEEYQLQG